MGKIKPVSHRKIRLTLSPRYRGRSAWKTRLSEWRERTIMAAVFLLDIVRQNHRRIFRRERLFRDRSNPLEIYDDVEIYQKFRFRRVNILSITQELECFLEFENERKGCLSPLFQVLITLRCLASNTFQNVGGEVIQVSQATVSRTVTRVVKAIIRQGQNNIKLPSQREANSQKVKFYGKAGIPEVIGCIDCTHVKIQAPWQNDHEFVNRKNFHSINVQLICDADLNVINCIAKWPGSVHDARILRESRLFQAFESTNQPLDGIILGDSGYMIRTWLMTPFANPSTRKERKYNFAHSSTRSTIERCIGVVKRRWPCLQSGLRVQPSKACEIIYACMLLHNRANRLGLPTSELNGTSNADEEDNEGPVSVAENITERQRSLAGKAVRARIVNQNF